MQDGEEKERLMRLHLDVLVNHHPGNKIEIIGAIGMFGHVYAKRQDWKSAEIWYRKALAYGTEHLGEENIEVAAQRFFVGRALLEQKRHIEAERLILASLKVAAKKLGDSVQGSFARTHQRVCARFLVRLYEEQEQSEQAERFRPLSVRLSLIHI